MTRFLTMGPATRAIHAGQHADPATGATVTPVYLTSTFTQHGIGQDPPFEYSRTGNPTRCALERCLAALEGAEHGLAFASGSAASAAVLSALRPGDHVVAGDDLYGGTYRLFERVWRPMGVTFSYADARRPEALARAATHSTRLFWIETPSNPLLHLADIRAIAEVAHAAGAPLAVDNTFATPHFQNPLELGADIVAHSTTKYIGGHSDVVGGAVLTSDPALHERLAFYQNSAGAVPGAFDAWLTLRGVKTLSVRMERHARNAAYLAAYLSESGWAHDVRYPGLPDHPQRELAARQMRGFGGMVSFTMPGGRAQADLFVRALQLFSFAESLGGVESLVCHPATMTHAAIPPAEREARGIGEGMLRLSVGIENVEDLAADLEQAAHVASLAAGAAA
jgi:cystathionine beta-lyase/cystathionine gamma-synthase